MWCTIASPIAPLAPSSPTYLLLGPQPKRLNLFLPPCRRSIGPLLARVTAFFNLVVNNVGLGGRRPLCPTPHGVPKHLRPSRYVLSPRAGRHRCRPLLPLVRQDIPLPTLPPGFMKRLNGVQPNAPVVFALVIFVALNATRRRLPNFGRDVETGTIPQRAR